MTKEIPFQELAESDLSIDATYKGGLAGNVSDDPLSRLLPCGNQGGFRYKVGPHGRPLFVVLYTDLSDPDWPDQLDPELGLFTYYGDNKRPGHELHDTQRGGNTILRTAFASTHAHPPRRNEVPPFLVFTKGALGRDVAFRGLAVPGAPDVTTVDDLVAVWRTTSGQRFQNYRAIFTVLDTGPLPRTWLDQVISADPESSFAPAAWLLWRQTGAYRPLRAPRTMSIRSPAEQRPTSPSDAAMISALLDHFSDPHDFERCAAEIWAMCAPGSDYTITPASRDGGRDAFGFYRLGPDSDPIRLDFALEAKCYAPEHSVGVRELSRLISRLRHRQFGVLVTTSYLAPQAYHELRTDGHPVVVIAARDIIEILKRHGHGDATAVRAWLSREFPTAT